MRISRLFLVVTCLLFAACESTGTKPAPAVATPTPEKVFQVSWPTSWQIDLTKNYDFGVSRGGYIHQGWDINEPGTTCDQDEGESVFSILDGEVMDVEKVQGGGVVVYSDTPHGPRWIRYGHTKDILVKVGQKVKSGERIASIGNVFAGGKICSHLHLDVRLRTHPYPSNSICSMGRSDEDCVLVNRNDLADWYEDPAKLFALKK